MRENYVQTPFSPRSEIGRLLELWNGARLSGEEICLATLVRVQGSSYRKAGAKILTTKSGLRVGGISGGCLEAEICRKIWWLTRNGPHVERFATSSDGADVTLSSRGLGCGGMLDVLYERSPNAEIVMECVRHSSEQRAPSAVVRVIESNVPAIPHGIFVTFARGEVEQFIGDAPVAVQMALQQLAHEIFSQQQTKNVLLTFGNTELHIFGEYVAPPHALVIFGAGDDAKPLAELAHLMGWFVAVADARGHLVTCERFPSAQKHVRTTLNEPLEGLEPASFDAAVIMTHSVEQDRELLKALLPKQLPYLGLLGARHRTRRLIGEVANLIGAEYAECMAGLRSPVGLAIGAETPETIALSVVAEIQAVLSTRKNKAIQNCLMPDESPLYCASQMANV